MDAGEKLISELTPGEVLDETLFPVDNQAPEAEKVTAADIKGYILKDTAGSFIELANSLSKGKSELLEVLTDKGINDLTVDNSISEMASAVRKLETTSSGGINPEFPLIVCSSVGGLGFRAISKHPGWYYRVRGNAIDFYRPVAVSVNSALSPIFSILLSDISKALNDEILTYYSNLSLINVDGSDTYALYSVNGKIVVFDVNMESMSVENASCVTLIANSDSLTSNTVSNYYTIRAFDVTTKTALINTDSYIAKVSFLTGDFWVPKEASHWLRNLLELTSFTQLDQDILFSNNGVNFEVIKINWAEFTISKRRFTLMQGYGSGYAWNYTSSTKKLIYNNWTGWAFCDLSALDVKDFTVKFYISSAPMEEKLSTERDLLISILPLEKGRTLFLSGTGHSIVLDADGVQQKADSIIDSVLLKTGTNALSYLVPKSVVTIEEGLYALDVSDIYPLKIYFNKLFWRRIFTSTGYTYFFPKDPITLSDINSGKYDAKTVE